MPEYLSPGVYIEEQDTGPEPIEGVSTSVTGFVGVTQCGPLDTNPPVLVTSFPEFTRIFGGYFTPNFSGTAPTNPPSAYNFLPHAVAGFFNNGGQLLYIKRIAAAPPPPYSLASVAIVNGAPSTVYKAGDVIAVTGGTTAAPPATLTVTGVTPLGAITSVSVTNPGSYTVNPPTPNTPGASPSGAFGATFNLTMSATTPSTLEAASVANGAPTTVYNVGDQLPLAGGTPTTAASTAIINVAGVTAGVITSVSISNSGSYTENPPLTPNMPGVASPSGAAGATFNLTMNPTGASAATSGEGLQNNVTSPQIVTRLTASVNSGALTLSLQSLRGIQQTSSLAMTQVMNGITTTVSGLRIASLNDANGLVTLTPAASALITSTFNAQYTTVSVTAGAFPVEPIPPPTQATSFALTAANPGAWGNGIQLQILPSSRASANVLNLGQSAPGIYDIVTLNSTANFYKGAVLEFNVGTSKLYAKIKNIFGNSIQVKVYFPSASSLNLGGPTPTTVRTCEFNVIASYGNVNETWTSLTLDDTTPYYYATIINNGSTLLAVPKLASPPNSAQPYPSDDSTVNPSTMPMAVDGLNVPMGAGADGGYPSSNDYIGIDGGPGNRTGIAALGDVDEISIIAAPGVTDAATQGALITQCETLKYRFAILDPNPIQSNSATPLSPIQTQRLQFDTKYAAIYFPSVIVDDPLTGNNLTVPPSGHMAGIYAQTDDSRGVWKAPANVVINGILDLEVKLSKSDQDILNPEPNNINALRDFTAQGRGLRVYGARCITSDEEWMYINVRRLFIFLEASLDQGTQWAVFEPNDQQLWNRLIQSVSNFLTTVWREGGLMGATADQAFFVKCGYDTMSQDDIENGRLIMEVGVAPVYPAEFVIIRIGQWAGGSSAQEL
jgi:phage tail sheath protein FI